MESLQHVTLACGRTSSSKGCTKKRKENKEKINEIIDLIYQKNLKKFHTKTDGPSPNPSPSVQSVCSFMAFRM